MRTADGGPPLGVVQCMACGRGFASSGPDDLTCVPCRLEIEARRKPQFLEDMEAVAANKPAQGDFQIAMKALLQKRPQDFIARLTALQQAYAERYKALEQVEKARRPTAPTQDAPEQDEGSERVEELIERLLKEAAS
jgi:hypothetical protein